MKKIIQKLGLGMLTLATVLSVGVSLFPSGASAVSIGCSTGTYRYGNSGTCVKYLQRMLNGVNEAYRFSTSANLVADGDFGPKTKAKVVSYQDEFNLMVDGVVGRQTWGSLCEDMKLIYERRTDLRLTTDGYNAGKSAGCEYYVNGYDRAVKAI